MTKSPSWTQLKDASHADLLAMEEADRAFSAALPQRVLDHLQGLSIRGGDSAIPVDRLTHCAQTATRAHRDNRDHEYVVCCLLHDIGDLLSPYTHSEIAAMILEPFVCEANHFMLKHHAVFQGYYFFERIGFDPNARDRFKDSEHYAHAVVFSEYDQASFDPEYDTLPLEFFSPMVWQILSQTPKWAAPRAGMTSAEISGLLSIDSVPQ